MPYLFLALLVLAPLLIEQYLRQLPAAPSCPTCHSVARQVGMGWSAFSWIPAFGRTFVAECARCGWKGRMRWRWAPEAAGGEKER